MRSVGKLTADLIAINKCGSDVSLVSLPVFRVVEYTLVISVLHSGIHFEHRHQSNSNLFYLFKHVGQYNGASLKIRSQKNGTVPANLVFRRKIWGARDNGIPPRSTPVGHFPSLCNALYSAELMNCWKCD